jgi:hypothetical protein
VILHLAYLRPSDFPTIRIDEQEESIPDEVLQHFRNLRTIERISSRVQVRVFDRPFNDRGAYLQDAISFIRSFPSSKCVVFLDPDTGLEPKAPSHEHVLGSEARAIFEALKS